jgi:hypothetical protein
MSDDVTQPDAAPDDTNADEQPDAAEHGTEHQDDDGKPFDREYVERLREESKGYRQKLRDTEGKLFAARVAATGRLADPTDMPFDAALVDDADALNAAIDALLTAKPHLATRKPAWGDVGAGEAGTGSSGPTWADLFRSG